MLASFRTWFNRLPSRNPVDYQQMMAMQIILTALLGLVTAGGILSFRDPLIALNDGILVIALGGALYLLRSGRFRLSVWVTVFMLLLALGSAAYIFGLRTSGPILFAFAIPLSLAALLLNRSDFVIATLFCNLMVIVAGIHDIIEPQEGGRPAAPDPTMAISQMLAFIIASILMGVVLDRFGRSLRRALRDAAVREQELALARSSLEEIVTERTAQLSAEVQSGQTREQELAHTLAKLQESQALVRTLSAPVIPILPGVLVAPIIGNLDDDRVEDLTSNVLRAIELNHAREMIFDVTGVVIIDARAVRVLLQTAAAAQLIGVEVTVAGIRPELAEAMVSLGIEIRLRTYMTLQEAVETLISEHSGAVGAHNHTILGIRR